MLMCSSGQIWCELTSHLNPVLQVCVHSWMLDSYALAINQRIPFSFVRSNRNLSASIHDWLPVAASNQHIDSIMPRSHSWMVIIDLYWFGLHDLWWAIARLRTVENIKKLSTKSTSPEFLEGLASIKVTWHWKVEGFQWFSQRMATQRPWPPMHYTECPWPRSLWPPTTWPRWTLKCQSILLEWSNKINFLLHPTLRALPSSGHGTFSPFCVPFWRGSAIIRWRNIFFLVIYRQAFTLDSIRFRNVSELKLWNLVNVLSFRYQALLIPFWPLCPQRLRCTLQSSLRFSIQWSGQIVVSPTVSTLWSLLCTLVSFWIVSLTKSRSPPITWP